MKFVLALILAIGTATASVADPARDEERAALLEALAGAETRAVAKAAETALWQLWLKAPNPMAQALLDRGILRMRLGDNIGALESLDRLVEDFPDYAEGWNQRAFARFRLERFDRSLEDIERALELEPAHFGALSGKYRILILQGRPQLALKTLERAAGLHPFLPERRSSPEPANER